MLETTSLRELREVINESAEQIAVTLLGEPNRSMSNARELRFGRKGSLALATSGPKAGSRYDHENAEPA
jgi:hypothetical protein